MKFIAAVVKISHIFQIRRWKRSLYEWAGEEPSDSANTSFCCSDSDSVNGEEQENMNEELILSHLEMEDIVIGELKARL